MHRFHDIHEYRVVMLIAVTLCLGSVLNVGTLILTAHAAKALPMPTTVHFPASDGATHLSAEFFLPKGQGPFPAVVMLHGCSGIAPFVDRYRQWAEDFRHWGYAALMVDSFGPRGLKNCRSSTGGTVQDRVKDAYMALRYLQDQPFILGSHISVIGWSNGGTAVIRPTDHSGAQVAKRPVPDFRAAIAFYPKCVGNGSFRIPFLMQMGAEDYRAPAAPCMALAEASQSRGEPLAIKVYERAGHGFDANTTAGGAPKKAVQQFLAEHLGKR